MSTVAPTTPQAPPNNSRLVAFERQANVTFYMAVEDGCVVLAVDQRRESVHVRLSKAEARELADALRVVADIADREGGGAQVLA